MSRPHIVRSLALITLLAAAACSETGDYLALAGGGFIFNYRIAEATYGIALKPMRALPDDGTITATFDNPSGGDPFVLSKEGPFNPTRIAFQTPPLEGVVADHPYNVVVVLNDGTGAELQRIEQVFESELDQSVLPDNPLVIGPGYQTNIDDSETAYPPSVDGAGPDPSP